MRPIDGRTATAPPAVGDTQRWHVPYALLPNGLAHDVTFEVSDGVYRAVRPGTAPDSLVRRFDGIALPGFANTHSHAFHRALRGRTHRGSGSFWTWRNAMYDIASRLDPETYYTLARAVYAEMVLAGFTSVGEFHYLHHRLDGRPYAYPNAMSNALTRAAQAAGLRITLLDTLYLSGGLGERGHQPLDALQQRFSDGSTDEWARRVGRHRERDHVRVGMAIHSVRAVPRAWLPVVRELSSNGPHARQRGRPLPVHVHLSEQPAENEACLAYYGVTPTQLLRDAGLLTPNLTAVHATHLRDSDIALLGRARDTAAFCPTTERDLADGIGPARALLDAGARISLGTDQHAIIDPFEEARGLEMHERLVSGQRGRLGLHTLQAAATAHDTLGWEDAGALRAGARADLVIVDLASPRTAGVAPDQVFMAATCADITDVAVDGRFVVQERRHVLGDVGALLREAIEPLWA
ncbi:MAG: formimidoylglutamate deiminase [Micrococcales bacterium]|nr:formimidoylglutamate deiminase [Micrococcales bacterium]